MRSLKYLSLTFITTSALANGAPLPPVQEPAASHWSLYAGFAGGVDILQGKRRLVEFEPQPAVDRLNKHELSGKGASFELFTGASYRIPNSMFSFGLDPYLAYSHVKSNDFNSVVVPVGNINTFSSVSSSWATKFGVGADLKAGLHICSQDVVFAFVGTQWRQFEFTFNDHFGTVHKHKNLWAFSWGLGYEHRFASSTVGIKFRNDLFEKGSFSYGIGDSQYRGNMKPKLFSVLLTYKYNFKG